MSASTVDAVTQDSRRWMLPALITILAAEDAGEIDRNSWDFNEYGKLTAFCVEAAELERFRVRFGGEFTTSVPPDKPTHLHLRLTTEVAAVPVMLATIQNIPADDETEVAVPPAICGPCP